MCIRQETSKSRLLILNEEKYFPKELESVKAVLDMRNEELGRLRREVEKLRLERRQGRGEDKETQTGSAAPDITQLIPDQRGRSSRILYSFHFTFLQIDRLNFDIRPDGDDTEDMDDVDDVEATKGKHEMKVSNVIIVTQTSFENPPNKKSERIASRFLY